MRKYITIILIAFIAMLLGVPSVSAKQNVYLPVLTYHHLQKAGTFNEDKSGRLIVTPEQFKRQLEYLKEAGYNSITSQDLQDYYQGKGALPPNPILITFDDGYESNYKLAYPILKELNMKATIFVVTRSIRDEDDPDSGLLTSLSWQQAREMVNSGLVDIQTHTHNLHHRVFVKGYERSALTTRLTLNGKQETDNQYSARLYRDLSLSKTLIEGWLGRKVSAISFPYGEYNEIAQQVCGSLGLNLQFTTVEGATLYPNRPEVFKRITVSQKYSGEDIDNLVQKYINPAPVPFKDTKNHWAEAAINKSLELKIVTGYKDNTFRPEQKVTRVEFLAFLNAVKPFEKQAGSVDFKDVQEGAWYYPLVRDAFGARIVSGYSDKAFKPEKEITREEAAVLIRKHLFPEQAEVPEVVAKEIGAKDAEEIVDEGGLVEADGEEVFADFLLISVYARDSVLHLTKAGMIQGSKKGEQLLFLPHDSLSRAEACVMMKNFISGVQSQ